ncbi:hypothetical protein H4R99_003536 [Coemansia sp. RSA 1722]|nr:hypothetical protein LPJ57_001131 [Coemansia sp. RSA 486]KAJ2599893.1 hypothetical protein H4R99_003536 [Coemansia sp. RSA 1722]
MASLDNADSQVYDSVKTYYGKVLASSKDLKTSACTAASRPPAKIMSIISQIPDAVTSKFYGCGNPIPLGIDGKDVLDLGSGSGRDCYIAAALVGANGSVTGIDMTDEQLETARENISEYADTLGYQPQMRFLTGYIEMIQEAGVPDESVDICISNCVVNLSPNKKLVLEGVYKALRAGGEFYFSDVYADSQLDEKVRTHDVLLGECIGGALFVDEFEDMAKNIGFATPHVLSATHIQIHDDELLQLVGQTKFYSITYRLFKPNHIPLDITADQQVAAVTYHGGIEGSEEKYVFDADNVFEKNVSAIVAVDTAALMAQSWVAGFFTFKSLAAQGTVAKQATPTAVLMQRAFEESMACGSSSSCCPPKSAESSGCCPPKKTESSGCCPPKKTESSGCCPPKKTESSGCCPPKKPTESSGCCPPKKPTESSGCSTLEVLNTDNDKKCC